MFEAYNKSVPLSMCVCVCACIAETARVRELKVILLLVLGQHECVRGEFYINSILILATLKNKNLHLTNKKLLKMFF